MRCGLMREAVRSCSEGTDGGPDFGLFTINLSNNVGNSVYPAITASGNNVYVVWMNSTLGTNQILYKGVQMVGLLWWHY